LIENPSSISDGFYVRFSQDVEKLLFSMLLDADGGLIYAMFPLPHVRSWITVTAEGKPGGSV
jgi:hypothetical protein